MRYLSVCSGIEAATVAWHQLGWTPEAYSEIEKFPASVLAHHYPQTPNLGDMTNYKEWNIGDIDLLVGGTPCQSFSVAGLRKGLDDPRGNLALVYLGIAERFHPRWLLWENVPGVLSSSGGRDFGSFLGAMAQLGYGFAYRVLDAQYFGVPQRRRRVFVVGYLGDWRRAAAVLFESHSLQGHPAPSRKKGEEVAGSLASSSGGCNDQNRAGAFIHSAIWIDEECNATVEGFGPLLRGGQGGTRQAVAFHASPMQVRRLTPTECERLQGFPDGYTNIPWRNKPESPDGQRYRALGNSMAVPCMRWLGERIQMVDDI